MDEPTPGSASVTGQEASEEVAFWKEEIETYDRLFDKFLRRGRKIYKHYKDVRTEREMAASRYNILWANTQTRLPALYARNPKVQVERRFKDADPIGRVASDILERSIQYTLDHCNDAWQVNRQAVLDFELPGRGVVWIRYVPHFQKQKPPAAEAIDSKIQGTDPGMSQGSGQNPASQPASGSELQASGVETTNVAPDPVLNEVLHYEETKLDYVFWEDYGHSWARFDEEIRGKWRRVYMDRKELKDRFGQNEGNPQGLSSDELAAIPLDWSPKDERGGSVKAMPNKSGKKAIVYEIWDKRERQALWICTNFHKALDIRPDPLGLEEFFPCPRPLYANLGNDDLVPTPNFAMYQDQANEVNELTARIASITKALKVAGVRDASAEGLDRLLSEGVENQLVPVNAWAASKEKGGLAGSFELLPMDTISETLASLREQRQAVIEDIYQITGISDIVRGMSDPEETATAQQLKGQFSMLRIEDSQQEVQRFARDEVRIIGQIVAGYSIETLKQISGVKLLTGQEKQQLQDQMAAQQRAAQMQAAPPPGAPQPGAAPPPQAGPGPAGGMHPGQPSAPQTPQAGQAPLSPDKLKLLKLPTWEEVGALLENPVMREFRLDIETDSTIRMDEEAEKAARMELISSVGEFVKQMAEAGQTVPQIMPMLGELLMFGIRAFKTARAVEQTFDDAMEQLVELAKQPKPPPEKLQEIQAQGQVDAMLADKKGQVDLQVAQGEQQAQQQQAQAQIQAETQRDMFKAKLDADTQREIEMSKTQAQKVLQDLANEFEMQRTEFEAQAKAGLENIKGEWALKLEQVKQEGERAKEEHERNQARQQQSHEKHITEKTLKAQGEQAELKAKNKEAA